jgi:hypothetical protein
MAGAITLERAAKTKRAAYRPFERDDRGDDR